MLRMCLGSAFFFFFLVSFSFSKIKKHQFQAFLKCNFGLFKMYRSAWRVAHSLLVVVVAHQHKKFALDLLIGITFN
jgi:hypothetical protein